MYLQAGDTGKLHKPINELGPVAGHCRAVIYVEFQGMIVKKLILVQSRGESLIPLL